MTGNIIVNEFRTKEGRKGLRDKYFPRACETSRPLLIKKKGMALFEVGAEKGKGDRVEGEEKVAGAMFKER